MARREVDLGPVDAYAIAVAEGYTGTREQWVQTLADAEANGLKTEGYAVGEQNGTPVTSGEYFENNAKYYNEQAQSAKEDAETAQTAAETAQTAAETAKTAAETAQTAAETAAARDTAAWLNEHITNPNSPPLDRTLMSSSAAAPADMVGDLKSALDIEKIRLEILKNTTAVYTNGSGISSVSSETGIITKDGTIDSSSSYTNYKAQRYPVSEKTNYMVKCQIVWTSVGVAFYDSNNNCLGVDIWNEVPSSTYTTVEQEIITPANCTYLKLSRYLTYSVYVNNIVKKPILEDRLSAVEASIGTATLKTRGNTLKAGINDAWDSVSYVADDLELNDYLQNKFVSFRWNDTYGYVTNQTAMSIIEAQKFPYDVQITNLHYPDFYGVAVRTFSAITASPENLIDTITYPLTGENAVNSITLPKNVYWTVQFTRPSNVTIDLATYKIIPHFIAGNNIKMASQLNINNTLLVGKYMAPYTRIQDAVDAANSGDTILILPGTYEEAVSAWGKEVHLIGLDRDSTIIIEKSGLYSTPTLEINIGSVRNLTLIETGEGSSWGDDGGKGRAYTVHIESGEGYTGVGELWFDNCKLINYAHAAIGCGLYQDLHVHFNNCYMYSGRAADVLDDYYRGTFYYHTCIAENVTGQRMTVKDCEIINEGTKAFYGGVATPGATTGNVRSTFINNNFYAMSAETQNTNAIAIVYNILNYHDCKLTGNSRGNNIPALNAP